MVLPCDVTGPVTTRAQSAAQDRRARARQASAMAECTNPCIAPGRAGHTSNQRTLRFEPRRLALYPGPKLCHRLGMTGIVGREVEIAAITEFLEGRAGGARALVLEGEPGIGKTTLWRWAAANAESHGISVLRAQPTEAEQELAFATLGDILAGVHD